MNEAKYSTTIKFHLHGFEESLTIRSDSDLELHLKEVLTATKLVEKLEGQPGGNGGNGHELPTELPQAPPVCKNCGSSEHMEHVSFMKDGKPKKAWKCQTCQKWVYGAEKGEKPAK